MNRGAKIYGIDRSGNAIGLSVFAGTSISGLIHQRQKISAMNIARKVCIGGLHEKSHVDFAVARAFKFVHGYPVEFKELS